MSDDQGWGDVGYHNHPHLKTPNLDKMAGRGMKLERFYSGAPVCSPTRGSALTGRHPFRYGIFSANVGRLPKEELTLAEALRSFGYTTGHFGNGRPGGRAEKISPRFGNCR
jgi:arylsulfatase A-like enzyme